MINRLVEHDSGQIRFAGEEIRSLPVLELRRRMGTRFSPLACFPTGPSHRTSPPYRNCKSGRAHVLMTEQMN